MEIFKRLLRPLCMAFGIVLLAFPVFGQDNPWKSRKICVFGMPTMGHAVKPRGKGLITDILTKAFKKERIELRHVDVPYKRALEGLGAGKIDCSLDVNHHKGVGLQAKSTLAMYDLAVAYLSTTKWEGVKSLEGKRVAYVHGFDLQDLLPVKFSPQLVYDLSSAYHMLERGHVEYVLDDNWLLRDALYDSKLPAAGFSFSEIESFEVRPVFSDTSRGRYYREVYDWRIREMIQEGDLEEIFREYGLSKQYMKRIRAANGME